MFSCELKTIFALYLVREIFIVTPRTCHKNVSILFSFEGLRHIFYAYFCLHLTSFKYIFMLYVLYLKKLFSIFWSLCGYIPVNSADEHFFSVIQYHAKGPLLIKKKKKTYCTSYMYDATSFLFFFKFCLNMQYIFIKGFCARQK